MTAFLLDDLTDSNVEFSLHTESGAGATGGGWQKVVGATQDAKVNNGTLHCDGVSALAAYINLAVPPDPEYFAESTFVHAPRITAWLLRFSAASYTGYRISYDYTTEMWSVVRHDGTSAGVTTGLSTPNTFAQAANPAFARSVRVEITTPDAATVNIKLIVDGATLLDVDDTHANRVTSVGHVGLGVYQKIDDTNGIRSITADVLAAASATQLTLSGPASGTTGAASSNFTVTADAAVSSDVTITPATTGSGTFSPASPVITSGQTSVTFTYTPSASETADISITSDGGLTIVGSPISYTSSAANTAPSFSGTISDLSATVGVALTPVDVSSLFSDAESSLTFSAIGTWPAGVTVSGAGVISGTPSAAGTYGSLQVRATDAGGLTADSNLFSVTVAVAVGTISVSSPLKNNTGTLLSSETSVVCSVLQAADLASVYETTSASSDGSGLLSSLSDAAITAGQSYHVAIKLSDGSSVGITGEIVAT